MDISKNNFKTQHTSHTNPIKSTLTDARGAAAGRGGALGSNYESSSKKLKPISHRAYFMQDVLRKIIANHHEKGLDHRFCSCGVVPNEQFFKIGNEGGVSLTSPIYLKRDETGASFSGLMQCKNKWYCPVCSTKQLIENRDKIVRIVDKWSDSNNSCVMLTQTLSHTRKDSLLDMLNVLSDTDKKLKSSSFRKKLKDKFGFRSAITAKEMTYGYMNGWHPHIHQIMFFEGEITPRQIIELKELLYSRWNSLLNKSGYDSSYDRGIDLSFVQGAGRSETKYSTSTFMPLTSMLDLPINNGKMAALYVAKFDKELTFEFTKTGRHGNQTFFGLLQDYAENPSDFLRNLILEFVSAVHKKPRIYIPKFLSDLLVNEELIDVDEIENSRKPIYEFTLKEWKQIVYRGLRQDIISIASNPEYSDELVVSFIIDCLMKPPIQLPPNEYRQLMRYRSRDHDFGWALRGVA